MKRELGGGRLGSGKRMQLDLHGYERSTHDLGYIWRSSMASGTLVPCICQVALPGDSWDIDLQAVTLTHPTVGPLYGSFKMQIDVFECPVRLYQSALHNNMLNIGLKMATIPLPQIEFNSSQFTNTNTDLDNSQINPSALMAYLGLRGIGYIASGSENRLFNAIPLLGYWDIYKNYYANKQETMGVFISPGAATPQTITTVVVNGTGTIPESPSNADVSFGPTDEMVINYTPVAPILNQIIFDTLEKGRIPADQLANWTDTGTDYQSEGGSIVGHVTILNWSYANPAQHVEIDEFPLANIDTMRENILASAPTAQFLITAGSNAPYNAALLGSGTATPSSSFSQCGLGLKTYQSDLFNNWLQTDFIDGTGGINEISAVAIDTTTNTFQIDALILARAVYNYLNRVAVAGATYQDWLEVTYDHMLHTQTEIPMYHGGLSKEVIFQQVVSLAQAAQQPLGTLGGRGHMSDKHKGGKIRIKVNEPSYIIAIVSLTPRIDYSQGNTWDTHLATMDDFHKPAFDGIGFQELITEQLAWWDTHWDNTLLQWVQNSAGKQPAWVNYMTNVNKVYGNFAVQQNEMFMILNRRYEPGETVHINDLTTYIDPTKYNYIFAQTSLDAQNFWVQIAVDMTVRRKMSAHEMPRL